MEIRSRPREEDGANGGLHLFSGFFNFKLSFRLKIGGNHVLDVVEEELLGMGKGGKKLIFSTSEAKLFEVEVVRVKARDREGEKAEDKTLETAQETSSKTVSQEEEEKDRNEESTGNVVGRMAKLGRAIVPGGGGESKEEKVRGETAEGAVKKISSNDKVADLPNKEEKKSTELQTERSSVKREVGGLLDVDSTVGDGERVGEGGGGGGGVIGGIGGVRRGEGGGAGGGGGVSEWSLVMSEVRLQNTELRMSLARVGEQLHDQ